MMKRTIAYLVLTILVASVLFWVFESRAQSPVKVGDAVPSFSLDDQLGNRFDVDEFLGNTAMVIYFYPKDDTPGCTKEACSFRDAYEAFTDNNVKVIGISSDDVESHKNFAEKFNLPFTLLADTKGEVRELFGVKDDLLGLIPGRVTYVIDKSGKVIFMYDSQLNASKHIDKSLEALKVSIP